MNRKLNENPDKVVVGHGAESKVSQWDDKTIKGKAIASFRDPDAIAFGVHTDGKWYFGRAGDTHYDIRVPSPNQVDFPGGMTSSIDRNKWKYPGRLWWKKKIISFWDYPPYGQLKKELDNLAKAWKAAGNDQINWNQWKIDIPRTEEMDSSMDGSKPADIWRGIGRRDLDGETVYKHTRLYNIKTVLGNKPLKGLGKPWKEAGKKINTDKGEEHVASPMKKKNLKTLTKKQKQDMWDYYKGKGKMDSADRRLYKALERSLKKEDLEISFDGERFIFTESPDSIQVSGDKHLFFWSTNGDDFPFGYDKEGNMRIGQPGMTHVDMYGNRRNFKYAGRMWIKKKVISFWQYPKLPKLKSILKDIEKTFNTIPLDNYGSKDFPTGEMPGFPGMKEPLMYPEYYPRAKTYGKIKFTDKWRLDVPSEADGGYTEFQRTTGEAELTPAAYRKSYLYSLKTVFSNKPLKGQGEKLRKGDEVESAGIDVDHVKPAMLKKNKIQKMSKREKEQLYNYFKDKGKRLNSSEKRMRDMVARSMKEEVDIFFDGEKFIFEEKSNKKYFTLEEGSGILTEFH